MQEVNRALENGDYDCVVVDLSQPPQQSLGEMVAALQAADTQLIVYAPNDFVEDGDSHFAQLARMDRTRVARSAAQLQENISLVLHRPFNELPANARAALTQLRRCDPVLSGRKVVVIDDDIRNIFSLTSALEEHGVELHYAESGRSGIELLQRVSDADAVLVDIMMPGMDGYETMRGIRSMPGFAALPLIAVTAKAMKGDRQKCIEAGASDYIAKPVDLDQLVSVLRVWFQRAEQNWPAATGTDNIVTVPAITGSA